VNLQGELGLFLLSSVEIIMLDVGSQTLCPIAGL
jgi:hypothetical protein